MTHLGGRKVGETRQIVAVRAVPDTTSDKTFTHALRVETMYKRVGAGLLGTGLCALLGSLWMADGSVLRASFWGWRVLFQAGVLAVCLGAVTVLLEPNTTTSVFLATGIGVLGQLSVSLAMLVVGGDGSVAVFTFLESILPLLPMGIGYAIGALRFVPALSRGRRLRLDAAGICLGFVVWILGYLFILLGYDTTVAGGIHPGFLLMLYLVLLVPNLVVGGVLYSLWRLFGEAPQVSQTRNTRGATPADAEQ